MKTSNQTAKNIIIKGDAKSCACISRFFEQARFGAACALQVDENIKNEVVLCSYDRNQDKEITTAFKTPVRLGEILESLQKETKKLLRPAIPSIIKRPTFILDTMHGIIKLGSDGNSQEIKLTDKETEILVFLHQNDDRVVSRRELLLAVWEYAENIETHTLETHIYRLRQKIESDPSKPKILITEDNGYRIR